MTTDTPPDDWSPADHPGSIAATEGGWWVSTVGMCAQRIRDGRGQAQQIDARLLVLALRQLLYATELQAEVIKRRHDMPRQVHEHLKSARKEFGEALPGVTEVRDRLIHFGERARYREAAEEDHCS
ncbi:hypothetical protein ACWGCW_11550 [Streptomyces sp. NPDC054933]